jgi:thiamine-phosphate pyrophosphorylase
MTSRNVSRIIDANINRVTEGLRVIEDIFRYYFDDPGLQQGLKELRHCIALTLDQDQYIVHRDSISDVGFSSIGTREYERETLHAVIRSNMKRSQEGLRVLEEIFKLESKPAALEMKRIRYALYDIDKKILSYGRQRLTKGLYLIMTDPPMGYEGLTELAVSAKIPAIQLRYKKDDAGTFLEHAIKIREITAGTDTLFIVNDRVDIALMAKADGIHLGQDDIPPEKARSLVGDQMLIGWSTHNLGQLEKAQEYPIDYVGFGPVFPTSSKLNPDPVTGVDLLRTAVAQSKIPVVAIGGITQDNLEELAGSACNNISLIQAVSMAKNPLDTMTALHERSVKIL